ncbi:MAG: hypothetical protein ABMA01_10375 [Chthoniobacteraceae bacterium]
MEQDRKWGLSGILTRYAEDASQLQFTKREILSFCHGDLQTAEAAFDEWSLKGGVVVLADIRTADPDVTVVRINLKRLDELYYEHCAEVRAAAFREMGPEEGGELLKQLASPQLRAETLDYLEPNERAEALKRLDPTLRAEIIPYLKNQGPG